MALTIEQQKYSPSGIVILYEIDFSTIANFSSTTKLYFSGYKDGTSNITWNGQSYTPVDIESDGFGSEIGGSPPEPTLTIGYRDISENATYQSVETAWTAAGLGNTFDWRGTKVTRRRTFEDDISDTSKVMEDCWYVDRLEKIDRHGYYFKLSVGLGIEGVNNRSTRRMSHAMCSLRYRLPDADSSPDFFYIDTECGGCPWGNSTESSNYSHLSTFGTPYYTIAEASTSTWTEDACNKTLSSCKLRFDPSSNGYPLPFIGLFRAGTKRTS